METDARPRPFTSRPEHWVNNRRNATVSPAVLTTDTGEAIPGVHIRQGSSWFILTEPAAFNLANQIADTLEAARERNQP